MAFFKLFCCIIYNVNKVHHADSENMQTDMTWIELNQTAFDHNVAYYKQHIGNASLMAVVKGNGYGHGIASIAHRCQHNNAIHGFVTVTLSEAILLRQQGITKPIVVMGYLDAPLDEIIRQNIQISVIDYTMLHTLEQVALHYKQPITIHVKVDTGLTRFGFMPQEVLTLVKKIHTHKAFILHGLCTHFGESGSADWSYTEIQRERFTTVIQQLKAYNLVPPLLHADKSNTALRATHTSGSGVRIGAGLYGLLAQHNIQQVLTWKSRIAHIRTLTHDSPLGYGQTYHAAAGQKIAFIPVGYYDGYDRRLANQGHVLIPHQTSAQETHSVRAPVIGRIAMNTITVDISHAPHLTLGDEVILLGDYDGLRSCDIAELTGGENPRDVIIKIRESIPRSWVTATLDHKQFLSTDAYATLRV